GRRAFGDAHLLDQIIFLPGMTFAVALGAARIAGIQEEGQPTGGREANMVADLAVVDLLVDDDAGFRHADRAGRSTGLAIRFAAIAAGRAGQDASAVDLLNWARQNVAALMCGDDGWRKGD